MQKINIICVGNLKDKEYISLAKEYEKRISRFAKVNIIEKKEYTMFDNISQTIEKESKDLQSELSGKKYVMLDKDGEMLSSEQLAKFFENWFNTNDELNFVIGGSYGVDNAVKDNAKKLLSFSKMTFPHRLARIMLLEQVYRALTINNNVSYHK
ncbi:MAG: 23S rRNA (pseudouridine(1915)-N(3))-methyltransferase RlmH [Clostridia bacterium]|nr:23S rRNA (pseudouridine(1915)-N(3))-methyltransferase RlmH [Clostridia bacterium]